MSPSELKARLFVRSQSECGRPEALDRMTVLAMVQMRRCLELPDVHVAMAVQTLIEFDVVQRGRALGDMALRTT